MIILSSAHPNKSSCPVFLLFCDILSSCTLFPILVSYYFQRDFLFVSWKLSLFKCLTEVEREEFIKVLRMYLSQPYCHVLVVLIK